MKLSEFKFTAIVLGSNSVNELKKTLNSFTNQTLNFRENIEIIVIDNKANYIKNIFNEDDDKNIKYIESNSPTAASTK